MIATGTYTSPQTTEGRVLYVDLFNRSVTVLLKNGPLTFDVPPTCEVLLNGERVKLRMLQPRDRVTITFCRRQGILTAMSLEVRSHWESTLSEAN